MVSGKKERVRSLGIDLLGGETGIDGYYDIMIKWICGFNFSLLLPPANAFTLVDC